MQVKFRAVIINKASNGKKYLDYHSNLFQNAKEIICLIKDANPDIVIQNISPDHFYIYEANYPSKGFDLHIYPVTYHFDNINRFAKPNHWIQYRNCHIKESTPDAFIIYQSCFKMLSIKASLEEALFFIDTYLFNVKEM